MTSSCVCRFEIPLGFGAHISLFAVLWAITTLIYTFYNTKPHGLWD
jgi:hypothetical protein